MKKFGKYACLAALVGSTFIAQSATASSHREAPAIAEDPMADNTDVYAFISPNDASKIVVVANYIPLLLPSSGPNFYKFADSVRYEIRFDNDGDADADITYRFDFDSSIINGGTFLYNTGAITSLTDDDLNVRSSYSVKRIKHKSGPDQVTNIASNVQAAPWYVGDRSFPNGTYDDVAAQAVKSVSGGTKLFAGPRDEPFFVDLHVFDLLGVAGAPTTDGVNVMSIVMEVPIADVVKQNNRPAASATGQNSVVGIYARALRRKFRVLRQHHTEDHHGDYLQVSRLGWPLVNEVIVPLGDKDKYNRSAPEDDVDNFGAYILDPEVPKLLNLVLNAGCPDAGPDGRLDIVGLLAPNNTTPADLLRININQGQTFAQSGFPNGRTLTDDVTDTLLTVACNNGGAIGDGVNGNDKAFANTFPYLAVPHSGNPL